MNDNHIRVGDASTAGAPDSARRGQARPSVRARVTAPAAAIAVRRNRPPLPVRQWRPRGSSARGTRSALTAIDHRLLAPGPPASRSTTELTTNPSRKTHHDQDCPHRRHRRRPVSRRAAISARRRRARPARPASSRRSTNSRPTATPSSSTKSAPPRPTSAPWPRSVPARPTAGRIPEHPSPGRHPHHRHRQDRFRRPRLLSSHAPRGAISRRCCPAAIALSCRAADYGLRRVCWVTTAAPHRSSQSSPMQSNAHQQNMSHRYVKPDQHPDRRSRLCSKSTDRNLLAGALPRRPPPRGRPSRRTCASRPGPDRLGGDRRALPTYPFLISRPRWWGAVPAGGPGLGGGQVGHAQDLAGNHQFEPVTWSSAAHRRSSWLDVAIFGYLAAGVPGAVAAVLRYVMPVRIFMTADARQPDTRMDLPDSRIACAARQLAFHVSSAFVANHGVRSTCSPGSSQGPRAAT